MKEGRGEMFKVTLPVEPLQSPLLSPRPVLSTQAGRLALGQPLRGVLTP